MALLKLTTKDGEHEIQLGPESQIMIDSPGDSLGDGPNGGTGRREHTFGPFRNGDGYPGFHRVSGLKKSGRAIVVTEAGTPPAGVADPTGRQVGDETADPWTETTKIKIDDESLLVVDHLSAPFSLAGLKSISLDEAA